MVTAYSSRSWKNLSRAGPRLNEVDRSQVIALWKTVRRDRRSADSLAAARKENAEAVAKAQATADEANSVNKERLFHRRRKTSPADSRGLAQIRLRRCSVEAALTWARPHSKMSCTPNATISSAARAL